MTSEMWSLSRRACRALARSRSAIAPSSKTSSGMSRSLIPTTTTATAWLPRFSQCDSLGTLQPRLSHCPPGRPSLGPPSRAQPAITRDRTADTKASRGRLKVTERLAAITSARLGRDCMQEGYLAELIARAQLAHGAVAGRDICLAVEHDKEAVALLALADDCRALGPVLDIALVG